LAFCFVGHGAKDIIQQPLELYTNVIFSTQFELLARLLKTKRIDVYALRLSYLNNFQVHLISASNLVPDMQLLNESTLCLH
ncbi:MAG: hypothetical protein ACAH08_02530, partial [Methylophilus sp.]